MAFQPWDYETVAASQSVQVMGPGTETTKTPGTQYFSHLIVVPATTSPGAIAIKDGADTAITVFTGGAGSVTSLNTFHVAIKTMNKTGSWQVTTGASVSVIAVGRFT
jgi:hypothetical protein